MSAHLASVVRGALVVAGSIPVHHPPRLREQRLRLHVGVDWARVKLVQVVCQDAQALLRRVVAVEPETGVAGVVIPSVEVLANTFDADVSGSVQHNPTPGTSEHAVLPPDSAL